MARPSSAAAAPAHLDRLTSLRFFAALAVVIFHVSPFLGSAAFTRVSIRPAATAVTFFFMLSGFVLTWSHHRGDGATRFWRRRVARVYPTHLVTWGAALAILYFLRHVTDSVIGMLTSLLLVQSFWPRPAILGAANPPSWSLSAEAVFYLAFPALHRLLRRRTPAQRWLVAAAAGAVIVTMPCLSPLVDPTTAVWLAFFFPAIGLAEFTIGMVLAMQLQDGVRLPYRSRWVIAAAATGGIACGLLPNPYWRAIPVIVPFALAIVAAAQRDLAGQPGWLLTRRSLIRLGIWSFALYLCHYPVIFLVVGIIGPGFGRAEGWALAAIITAASIALAGVLHHAVERPAERWLRGGGQRVEVEEVTETVRQ